VLAKEHAPAELPALRSRRDPGTLEHVADEAGRDVDAELTQLADDPNVTSVAVLAREPHDQFAHLPVERRSP
jgi:hypothetical protein